MKEQDLAKLPDRWRVGRALMLVQKWDCVRGLLFVSDNKEDLSVGSELAQFLADKVIKVPREEISQEKKDALFGGIYKKEVEGNLFQPEDVKVCLLAENLEEYPELVQAMLKGLMEHGFRPFCCIATTNNPDGIPDYLSSMFFEVVRIGSSFDSQSSS